MAHILVIDDEAQARTLLRQMLEMAGHEVTDAPDGKRGIELYQERPPDLVIMDLIMPEKDGIETTREIRRSYPDAKVIAISGGGRISPEDYLHLAGKLGANRTLAKPFRSQELLSAVAEVLGEKGEEK